MSQPVALRLTGITRRFGETLANDDISLSLHEGEVLALLGENGAGKTTLMSILFGHYSADAGTVEVAGRVLPPGQPRAAIAAGVGMVHQHFSLAANLSVLENVMAGTRRLWHPRADRAGGRAKLDALSQRFGLRVDPDRRLGDLSVGEQQRVEILKALYNDVRILILDEPTAVLTPPEALQLYQTLRGMARKGLSVIFISHKLHEVMDAADRVVVLRRGRVVAERRPAQTSKDELAELMVGRRITRPVRAPSSPGEVVIRAEALQAGGQGASALKGVSFTLRAGETLGIVGVSGNGQSTLGQVLSGVIAPIAGQLTILGQRITRADVSALVRAGVGRIAEDRNHEGVVGELTLWENATLERIGAARFSCLGVIDRAAARAHARKVIEMFDVRGGGPDHRTQLLSGGNIQKLILGRNLIDAPRVLIAAQPTRGLDEGAIAAVHTRLLAARAQGAAVLLISEDLDEVIALSDRICAIVGGRLSPEITAEDADARRLGLMMAGDWTEGALHDAV
ncbi:MAG: ABC transporter ATP-binding protein [Roseinatronobacter sp.]